jgi:putative methionine-R-sulfoxide reductase with GAF domain
MKQSQLWLAPFQGMVAAVMGAFFVKDISAEVAGTRQAEAPSSG